MNKQKAIYPYRGYYSLSLSLSFFFFFCFLGPHLQHMQVPRLGAESELQMPAYDTATETQDLSHVCDLNHSSWKHWILNLLSEARDRTRNLMVTSQICFCCTTTGTPPCCTTTGTPPSPVFWILFFSKKE